MRHALLLHCLLCVTCLAASAIAQNPQADQLAQSASQKYRSGDLQSAVDDFRHADQLKPNDPNILFGLAQALGDQGSLAESEQLYLRLFPLYDQLQARGAAQGITYKPSIAMAWNNLAAVYCRDNHFADARGAIDRAFST